MKYLSPEIAKHAKKFSNSSNKSLAKPGISCGIFQDCNDTEVKYSKKIMKIIKKKNN